ncbi:MAG: hypothetical protein LBL00_03130 [Endomicrobium sp.]|jgi:hypothetical protein|nr:hypothetical protein [Endomicrobium sp.]
MYIDNPKTYKNLLTGLVCANIFFVIFMTSVSFLIFVSYDTVLWQNCPKFDILKVFIQNIRFNLSIAGYFNIPVFLLLCALLAFSPAHITKFFIKIIRLYYLLAFIEVFSLLTLSHMLKNIPRMNEMMISKYLSKLSSIYSFFNNTTFMTMLIVMSVLFLITVIFFLLFLKIIFTAREYTVENSRKAMITTVTALLICILLAKGKVIGHLTVKDASVTPVVQLNEYAIRGPYKILHDLKNFDFSNIMMMRDKKKLTEGGFEVLNFDDEEKAKELLYKFTPMQEL